MAGYLIAGQAVARSGGWVEMLMIVREAVQSSEPRLLIPGCLVVAEDA
jgi:hypothetical protein